MSDRHLLGRRQFLKVSSTCAVAAAAIGPRLFAAESASPKRLAVGFASFEESTAVADASGIPSADGAFIGRGARVTASGASGVSGSDPRARRAVELVAHFSYFDGAERRVAPFRAWSCSRVTGCQGNRAVFTVPVDEVQKIVLTVGVERGTPQTSGAKNPSRRTAIGIGTAPAESTVLPLTLSLQNEPGAYRLARGFYVVAPMFEGDADPRWSSWSVRSVEGRWQLVDAGGNTAPFEHLVLSMEYAVAD